MAHEIFGDRLISRRTPAWHKIGEVFPEDEKITASEAITRAGIDFTVEKTAHRVLVPTGTGTHRYIESKTAFSVVRPPLEEGGAHQILGNVGSSYEPIQAKDLATMLDPISEKFPVETAGAVAYGKKIFLTLDAGQDQINNEDHSLYYLVTDNRDGGGALSIAFTPIRIVCMNTLVLGLRRSSFAVAIQHTSQIKQDAEWYINIFAQMQNARESTITTLNELGNTQLSSAQAEKILDKAYPNPSLPNRVKILRGMKPEQFSSEVWRGLQNEQTTLELKLDTSVLSIENQRSKALELYDIFNQEHPRLSRTPWAMYQAVVENEDHTGRNGRSVDGASALYGHRSKTKSRAFNEALAIAQKGRFE